MFGLTFKEGLALVAVVVVVAMVALFLWDARRRNLTPKQEVAALRADPRGTLEQLELKAGGLADTIRDAVVRGLKDAAAALPEATLHDAYFDVDDFLMDLGRLPASYSQTVLLNGAIKRGGSAQTVEYFTQPNGNVTKTKPASA